MQKYQAETCQHCAKSLFSATAAEQGTQVWRCNNCGTRNYIPNGEVEYDDRETVAPGDEHYYRAPGSDDGISPSGCCLSNPRRYL